MSSKLCTASVSITSSLLVVSYAIANLVPGSVTDSGSVESTADRQLGAFHMGSNPFCRSFARWKPSSVGTVAEGGFGQSFLQLRKATSEQSTREEAEETPNEESNEKPTSN